MRYLGGKHLIAKDIARIINIYLTTTRWQYVEPFCGGLNVSRHVNPDRPKILCDYSEDLITLYKAMQQGWQPPAHLSEKRYAELKAQKEPSAEKAFAGFACSFGAKFFGGYARDPKRGRNFADVGRRGLLKKFEELGPDVVFRRSNFLESKYKGCLIYCDPPYAGTTGYKSTGAFDSAAFWQKCRDLSGDNLIFISEYAAPEDFIEVWSKDVKAGLSGKGHLNRVEKLFTFI